MGFQVSAASQGGAEGASPAAVGGGGNERWNARIDCIGTVERFRGAYDEILSGTALGPPPDLELRFFGRGEKQQEEYVPDPCKVYPGSCEKKFALVHSGRTRPAASNRQFLIGDRRKAWPITF